MQNKMDWNAVRDFLAVARLGSLSQAAEALDVNASTVGRRIEALENALGTRLFQRAQTGYVLTDEGERLISRAERVEEAAVIFEGSADASDVVSGRVRLATAENLANFLLIPALPSLTASAYSDRGRFDRTIVMACGAFRSHWISSRPSHGRVRRGGGEPES